MTPFARRACGSIAVVSINDPTDPPPMRQRLRQSLVTAMKARDQAAVAALRSALAAIDNAEAVVPDGSFAKASAIEVAPIGAGATEVSRQTLAEADILEIVRKEIAEREAAARTYDEANQPERAGLLRQQANVLLAHVEG